MGQVIRVNIKWKHLVIGLDERYSEIMNKAKTRGSLAKHLPKMKKIRLMAVKLLQKENADPRSCF